jgi:hypothetical protein
MTVIGNQSPGRIVNAGKRAGERVDEADERPEFGISGISGFQI